MERYKKGVIYKIYCNDSSIEDFYIGSTCSFAKRKHRHKKNCVNTNTSLYECIRNNGGWDNWSMKPIKLYPCNSKLEMNIEEQKFIDELKPKLNMIKAYMNEEQKNNRSKEYYNRDLEKNRKKNNERNKKKIVCDCGKEISIGNLSTHKRSQRHIKFLSSS
tara:strand:+ start:46 stop:528 length:483 start_codon:yes stop_codon:yes gene_type:complete